MVSIQFHTDENFYFKMKEHKLMVERENMKKYSWEEYIKILFGMGAE